MTLIGSRSNLNTVTTLSHEIPSNRIPATAKEFLVYVTAFCGRSEGSDLEAHISYYIEENGTQYRKFLFMRGHGNTDLRVRNTNSENMWFPMPFNRMIHVNIPVALQDQCFTSIYAIGYR